MSGGGNSPRIAFAALAAGAALLLLAEAEILRVAAAALLLTGIALGVFAIATPEFVARDEEEPPPAPRS
ncbi:MAG: hypothetical protein ACRDK9_05525 [Solirubrobacterales bacterium]